MTNEKKKKKKRHSAINIISYLMCGFVCECRIRGNKGRDAIGCVPRVQKRNQNALKVKQMTDRSLFIWHAVADLYFQIMYCMLCLSIRCYFEFSSFTCHCSCSSVIWLIRIGAFNSASILLQFRYWIWLCFNFVCLFWPSAAVLKNKQFQIAANKLLSNRLNVVLHSRSMAKQVETEWSTQPKQPHRFLTFLFKRNSIKKNNGKKRKENTKLVDLLLSPPCTHRLRHSIWFDSAYFPFHFLYQ